jgi:hypothetical protein
MFSAFCFIILCLLSHCFVLVRRLLSYAKSPTITDNSSQLCSSFGLLYYNLENLKGILRCEIGLHCFQVSLKSRIRHCLLYLFFRQVQIRLDAASRQQAFAVVASICTNTLFLPTFIIYCVFNDAVSS